MARAYADTETRRQQVAEAALQTIAEHGVAGFTTRAVAARVGISDGTLFRHFSSKEEIVLEGLRRIGEEMDRALVDTGDPLIDLEAFFRRRAALVGEQGSVGRLLFSDELVHLAGEAGRAQLDGWRRRSVAYLLDRLGQLRADGRLRADLDVPALGILVQGVLLTFAMQASLGRAGDRAALDQRIDAGWRTLRVVLLA